MVSGRPLLYLSLPGVAFILGVFWFRRRNKNRIPSGEPTASEKEAAKLKNGDTHQEKVPICNGNSANGTHGTTTQSKSMDIGSRNRTEHAVDENPATKLFGKSAPIKIVQNGRSSPIKPQLQPQQQQVDSEALKTKIQNVDHKALRSIDEDFENLSSPVDLPDSVDNRISFYARNVSCKRDEPVVIRATGTPKISPENSFLESKYTKECEQNNNCEETAVAKTEAPQLGNAATVVVEEKCSTENTTTIEQEQKGIEGETEMDANGNEKRNVDAASPSLSLCSMQSGDSGKGSSLPRSEATRAKVSYEFFVPNSLVGILYGRRKKFIKQVGVKSNASIKFRQQVLPDKLRICVIEGTEVEVNAALNIIRRRIPLEQYPNFTMQRIFIALPQTIVPLSTESLLSLHLLLIVGINNDVVVSSVISGGHIFVQHPLHPSHPSLAVLQKCLYESYTDADVPLLPSLEISALCVLPVNGIWYRVQIISQDAEDDQRCIVQFLDFGGYMNVHLNELRQIRSDFMAVPFQATECILSNIEPIGSEWSPEAADILCKLTKGIVLQAQVAGYNSHNIPEIYLFASLGPNNVVFINKELVARNLARWVD